MAGSSFTRTLPFVKDKRSVAPWRSVLQRVRSNETLKRLVEMPLTVAGAGCFSTAAFIGNEIAGFAVTGVCLIVLELMISDPDSGDVR